MFKGKKYQSKGVNNEIPLYIQILLWDMIDNIKIKKDYLQVFIIKTKEDTLKIIHKQEVPEYYKIYKFKNITKLEINQKIFVIDDYEYSTMILANEY